MKRLLAILALVLVAIPAALSISDGDSLTPEINTEEFQPLIWQCDTRVVLDDAVEGGRMTGDGEVMTERTQNYAFEGEQLYWHVLVMDKNKIEDIQDVVVTLGTDIGPGNDIEVECNRAAGHQDGENLRPSCNARIGEEELTTFDEDTMDYYVCIFTVETPDSMYGEYWVTTEVIAEDGEAAMDEHEWWFFNPIVAISVDGDLVFDEVRPGTMAYSDPILVGNDADEGSGVMLDTFITGTDFYDSDTSGAKCPITNQLSLSNFRYSATHGAYSTGSDIRADTEGYVDIDYGDSFSTLLYDDSEIMQSGPKSGKYYLANILSPGAEMALTFRLSLPEPCKGNFDTGSIFFWGEAI